MEQARILTTGRHEAAKCGLWEWLICRSVTLGNRQVVFAVVLVCAIAFARAPMTQIPDALFVSDGFGYYIYLPSLLIDGDLNLSNQLGRIPYEGAKQFFRTSDQTGLNTNQFPIGCALLLSPAFLLADWTIQVLNMAGCSIDRTGFGYAYELPVYLLSFAYGLGGIWLMERALRDLFPKKIADFTLFGIVFATPTAYYLWFEPNMSHSIALFLVALWVWLLLKTYHSTECTLRSWIFLGVVLGFVALVRPYSGVIGISAIPVAVAIAKRRFPHQRLRALMLATGWLLVCLVIGLVITTPQLFAWKILYGEWFVIPRGSGYEQIQWIDWRIPSFAISIFTLSPILLPAVIGLTLAPVLRTNGESRAEPQPENTLPAESGAARFPTLVAPAMVIVLILFILLAGGSRDWMLGTAFGQRRMVDWMPFLALGLGVILERFPRFHSSRSLSSALVGLAAVNGVLIGLYILRLLPEYGRVI